MNIKLISVGKVKEQWIKEGISEFEKRIKGLLRFESIELKDSNPEKESLDIISKIKNEKVFLLDETGKEYTSGDFAELVKKENYERDIVFVIGGPNGLSDDIKKKYPRIALSKMTFTHEMARLFFIEQLYRAVMINGNRSYHK